MKASAFRPAAHVLGIDVDALHMPQALAHVAEMLGRRTGGYVCVAGVHGVMEARNNPELRAAYANSDMTIPDGMPLVWVGHSQGHSQMSRVTGPDLMLEIFRRPEFKHITHYLYGGQEGVAEELRDKLVARFPWVRIIGFATPPFCETIDHEQEDFIATINLLKPDIVWVGISCPKQEIFMARHLPQLGPTLMFGVGAAFDYHTGRIRDCSEWIKKAGLQWLHRLLQDPRRLWRRYLRTHPRFVWQISLQLLNARKPAQTSAQSSKRPSAKVVTID